jgi:GDP-4-dehydro-6-deoxy-D-mannose reductase
MAAHRILVTGLGGFVGATLAQVASRHPQAAGLALLPLAAADGAAIDIRDADAVDAAVARLKPDAVVHLAAVALPRQAAQQPAEAWAVNLMGTFNLAEAVRRRAPGATFVFAGSAEAYGVSFARAAAPVREDEPLEPLSPYGATKAAADLMVGQMARDGLRAVRFRPFNHAGPGQAPAYVVSSFARQVVRIERGWQAPAMRVGNLSVRRDILDARDVVRAYLDAALGLPDAAAGRAFNLATGAPVPIGSILETLAAQAGLSVEIEVDQALVRPGEIATVSGDPSQAARILGWRPVIALEDTLAAVLAHWRAEADRDPESVRG